MKKLFITYWLLSLWIFSVESQELYSFKYGRVTQHEMDMTEYDADEDAEAVVIYETGNNSFKCNYIGDFELHMEKSIKIKILTQAGLKYGEFEIPYYTGSEIEKIENLEGTTYNYENGQLIKALLEKNAIFDEKINNNWSLKKFAMPDVREGSIVEIKYTIVTPYFFNMREWEFQKKIPVIANAFQMKITPFYEYSYILKGYSEFDNFYSEVLPQEHTFAGIKYKEVLYHFQLNNIPAFRDEEFITSEKDYMVSLHFQLSKVNYPDGRKREIMSTWPDIVSGFLKHDEFGKYMKSAEKEGKKILAEFSLQEKDVLSTVRNITEYVKCNYNWDGYNSDFATKKISDFLRQKSGNSANINLFLAGLLRAAKIDAYPILLSTRRNGKINPKYPFSHFFNYVIVGVDLDGETIFLDGTESMLVFNGLPNRCMHVNGLVVKEKSDKWIDISLEQEALTQKTIEIRFTENLRKIQTNAVYIAENYSGFQYRNIYRDKKENIIDFLKKRGLEPQETISVENYDPPGLPFVLSFTTEEETEDGTMDKIFLSPFLNHFPTDNLFKQKERNLPVDLLYLDRNVYKSTIYIPEGFEIEYIPKNTDHDSNIMTFTYHIEVDGGKIHTYAEYKLKQIIYDPKDYYKLKTVFGAMIDKAQETIVLTRISENKDTVLASGSL